MGERLLARLLCTLVLSSALSARAAGNDRDGDGIPDLGDLCPNEPEDRDGFEDEDGCPDPDNDKDRILDKDDKCPNEPETYNGFQDDDGCPDHAEVNAYTCSGGIVDHIFFRRGSARIAPAALPIVDAIAQTIIGNPIITGVEIAGYASEDERSAESISLARARTLTAALSLRGVSRLLLTTKGYGAHTPVDRAHTEVARQKNRRVEFHVRRQADPPEAPSR